MSLPKPTGSPRAESPSLPRPARERIAPSELLPKAREERVWEKIIPGWRLIHGSFPRQGLSIEEHDFRASEPIDWARSFHPDSLEICLNLTGTGTVRCGARVARFLPNTMGYYIMGNGSLEACRTGGERHRFITLEVSRAFLRLHLAGCEEEMRPEARAVLESLRPPSTVAPVQRMNLDQQLLVRSLRSPPVSSLARPLWYQGKTLEIFTQVLFSTPAPSAPARGKRNSRERAESVVAALRNRLDQPPSLKELGREAGCSAFHLSRIFSEETGSTIPQHLRRLRVERAAELLATGDYNVTEAAMEVGYKSLSHFTKTFRELMGCCPGLYPHARLPVPPGVDGRRP